MADPRKMDDVLLVSEDLMEQVVAMAHATNPFRQLSGPHEYAPLTLRERFRVWRHDVRWSVHDRLFPDCGHGEGDDY